MSCVYFTNTSFGLFEEIMIRFQFICFTSIHTHSNQINVLFANQLQYHTYMQFNRNNKFNYLLIMISRTLCTRINF